MAHFEVIRIMVSLGLYYYLDLMDMDNGHVHDTYKDVHGTDVYHVQPQNKFRE